MRGSHCFLKDNAILLLQTESKRNIHMNEVLRQEKKFLISLNKYYELSNRVKEIVKEDPNNRGEGYTIRSLYFDSIDNRDYQEKEDGVELRRKIRLRNYGPDSPFAKLEMKQKQGAMQKKRSLKVSRQDAQALIHRDYSVLLKYEDPFAAECFWMMNQFCYLPKTVIEYKRKAFIAEENSTRITFDHHIVGTENSMDIFSEELLQNPLMNPYLVILEIKFNGFLLEYIKDILMDAGTGELAVSKYCLGRAVSMHYHF